MQSQLRKACPRCHAQTGLTAARCLTCGHQYRTLFVPPQPAVAAVQPTRKLYVLAPNDRDMSARQAAMGLAAVIALSGLIGLASPAVQGRANGVGRTDKLRRERAAQPALPTTGTNAQPRIAENQPRIAENQTR